MLIGLDAIPLTQPLTGVGHYTLELARALARTSPSDIFRLIYPSSFPSIKLDEETAHLRASDEAAHFVASHSAQPIAGDARPVADDARRAAPPGVVSTRAARASNLTAVRVPVGMVGRHWWSMGLPLYARRAGVELFHGTNYDVPLWGGAISVLTVHDLSLLLHPATHEARRVRRARLRLPLMARAATAVITPTESVRREVCERLGVAPAKVFAVPEAPRDCFGPLAFAQTTEVRRRLGVGDEFLLAVGTIEPRKNLGTLLRAFEEVAATCGPHSPLQLVIAGAEGWLTGPLFALLNNSPVKDRVLFTGYLSDAELRALYASCRVFVYPSLYEGFGLPPLEAMACGAPVVAGRIPSIVETTGGAALLFNPEDAQELAQSILDLLRRQGARAQLGEQGIRRAAEFSWERAARLTREVYAEASKRFRN